jgi:large subunit ribosomal protein L21
MDYAVIKTGGKQYRVSPGDVLQVEKLDAEPGSELSFTEVLMTAQGGAVQLGTPTVLGARVIAEVLKQGRAKKILVYKKKRRKNYRRRQGPPAVPDHRTCDGNRTGSQQPWRIKRTGQHAQRARQRRPAARREDVRRSVGQGGQHHHPPARHARASRQERRHGARLHPVRQDRWHRDVRPPR